MKAFLIWLVLYALGYGALGGGYHFYLSENPNKIAIVVDSSFAMKKVWPDIPELLESLSAGKRYTQFALMSEKRLLHTWREKPALGNLSPYAPLNLSKVQTFAPLDEATEIYVITNASRAALADLPDWDIVRGPSW